MNYSSAVKDYSLPDGYVSNSVRATFDVKADKHYWSPGRIEAAGHHQYSVYRYAITQIRKHHRQRVIDIGCGPAVKLEMLQRELSNIEIVGIDQKHPIEYCRQKYSYGRWLIEDFENPSEEITSLTGDFIICADVIEHVLDPDKLLNFIQGCATSESLVLISTPDRIRLHGEGCLRATNKDHVREWTKEEFSRYLTSKGWNIIEHFHAPGVRRGPNRTYVNTLVSHLLHRRPRSMNYNQVVLAKIPIT